MRNFFIIIIGILSLNTAIAQKPLTFIEVDTASYHAYLNSDWNQIIDIGKKAINDDIDYYYLRLRIAYAYFMKSRYLLAIPYYKKALEFSNKDAVAMEYLYYSYQYSGRSNDAEKLVGKFTPALKTAVQKEDSEMLSDLHFISTFGTGADPGLRDEISQTAPDTMEGSQVIPNSYKNYNFGISHRIGRSIILHHSASLLYKDEYAYSVVKSIPYISESQIVRQLNYHVAADVTPVSGLHFTPVFSFINYRIPVFYEYGMGSGNNRSVYSYNSHSETVEGIKISKELGLFMFSLAASHSNLNLSKQNTASASLTIYPLANLNLYLTASGYFNNQKQNDKGIQQFVHSYTLGFRPVKFLWIEGYTTFGSFSNLYDPYTGITYNSLELYRNISNLSVIVPFYKSGISLFAGYRHHTSESMFVPVDGVFEIFNKKSFNYQSFTIGMTWKI